MSFRFVVDLVGLGPCFHMCARTMRLNLSSAGPPLPCHSRQLQFPISSRSQLYDNRCNTQHFICPFKICKACRGFRTRRPSAAVSHATSGPTMFVQASEAVCRCPTLGTDSPFCDAVWEVWEGSDGVLGRPVMLFVSGVAFSAPYGSTSRRGCCNTLRPLARATPVT